MRVGLVGMAHFHAPFILAADGVELAGVVARAPARVAAVRADLPGIPIHDSLKEFFSVIRMMDYDDWFPCGWKI